MCARGMEFGARLLVALCVEVVVAVCDVVAADVVVDLTDFDWVLIMGWCVGVCGVVVGF